MNTASEHRGRSMPSHITSSSNEPSVQGRPTKWAGSSARRRDFDKSTFDTIITGHLTLEQLDAYQQQFRIAEITNLMNESLSRRRPVSSLLPSGNLERNPNFKRDASPPPSYDKSGVRTNTRDARINDQLEKERSYLIEVAAKSVKNFVPPIGYRKQTKTMEKLYIPVKDYPDINFVGLLLGPRGKTLRLIQDQSGARLAIRGKGSVKEGKSMTNYPEEERGASGPTSFLNPNLNSNQDDLHVVITADLLSSIAKAIQLTNEIIEKAISSPEGQNNLKRDQLRELAVLNGTLRETRPYGADGEHRLEGRNGDFTDIVCNTCGKVGHFARDCLMRGQGSGVATGTNAAPLPPRALEKRVGDDSIDLPPWKVRKEEQVQPPWQAVQTGHPMNAPPPPVAAYLAPGIMAPQNATVAPAHVGSMTQSYSQPPPPPVSIPPPPGVSASLGIPFSSSAPPPPPPPAFIASPPAPPSGAAPPPTLKVSPPPPPETDTAHPPPPPSSNPTPPPPPPGSKPAPPPPPPSSNPAPPPPPSSIAAPHTPSQE